MPEGATDATSTTTPEPTLEGADTTTSNTTNAEQDAPLGAAGEKALAEWKERARSAEKAAKAAQSELTKVQKASMTETEKAVAEAEERGRNAALAEVGASRVDDAVRLALADRGLDVDALLEGLNRAQFLDDAFQPDREAIAAWADRIAPPKEEEPEAPVGPLGAGIDLGQGSGGAASIPIGDDKALENMLRDVVGLPKRT